MYIQNVMHISGGRASHMVNKLLKTGCFLACSSPTSSLGMRLALGTSWWIWSYSERREYD